MAIPSVLGTPACVLDALAFTAALALCLAWVDTPIWCGLVRGLPVGKDGGGRARRGRRVGISRLPLDAAVTVLTATDVSNDAASSPVVVVVVLGFRLVLGIFVLLPPSLAIVLVDTRRGGRRRRGGLRLEARLEPSRALARALARSNARRRASACLAARIAAAFACVSAASSSWVSDDAGWDRGDDAPDGVASSPSLDMVAPLTLCCRVPNGVNKDE